MDEFLCDIFRFSERIAFGRMKVWFRDDGGSLPLFMRYALYSEPLKRHCAATSLTSAIVVLTVLNWVGHMQVYAATERQSSAIQLRQHTVHNTRIA